MIDRIINPTTGSTMIIRKIVSEYICSEHKCSLSIRKNLDTYYIDLLSESAGLTTTLEIADTEVKEIMSVLIQEVFSTAVNTLKPIVSSCSRGCGTWSLGSGTCPQCGCQMVTPR
jgi:hypothetical protein